MRTLHRLLCFVLPLLLVMGCGGGGSPADRDLFVELIRFFVGDARTQAGDASVEFGVGGSPIDGEWREVGSLEAAFLATIEELKKKQDLNLLLMWIMTPRTGTPLDAIVALDYITRIQTPAGGQFVIDLLAPVGEDDTGELVALNNSIVSVRPVEGTSTLTADLPRAGRIGFLDTSLTLDIKRTILGDGTADFDVTASADVDTPLTTDVLVTLGSNAEEDIGRLLKRVDGSVTRRFNGPDSIVNVGVRFEAVGDPFFKDCNFEMCLPPPPLTPRIVSVASALEGLGVLDRDYYNALFPTAPAGPNEFGVVVANPDGLERGILQDAIFALGTMYGAPTGSTYRTDVLGLPPPSTQLGARGGRTHSTAQAALLAVGSWGLSIAPYDHATHEFGTATVVDTGNMTDLSPFHGDPYSGGALVADNSADAIKTVTRTASYQYVLDPAATVTGAAWAGASGKVVSAFRHASGDTLFVTDGDPGELWVLKPGATTASLVGTVGTAPRTVRAAGNIAAVGSYGGTGLSFGALGLFVRSAAGTWGRAPFSKTGPRIVGLAIKQLPDSRVAVAYPSFLGNELGLMILDNITGEIRNDTVVPLPAGCTGAGHCAFVRDPGQDAVLVTCNTSGHLVLMPVSYDE